MLRSLFSTEKHKDTQEYTHTLVPPTVHTDMCTYTHNHPQEHSRPLAAFNAPRALLPLHLTFSQAGHPLHCIAVWLFYSNIPVSEKPVSIILSKAVSPSHSLSYIDCCFFLIYIIYIL